MGRCGKPTLDPYVPWTRMHGASGIRLIQWTGCVIWSVRAEQQPNSMISFWLFARGNFKNRISVAGAAVFSEFIQI